MINIGNDIIIKDVTGNDKLSLGVSEDFVHTKELMKENSITIKFKLNVMYDFFRGDYLEYEGEKFLLRKNYQPEEISTCEYNYELVFEGLDMQLQDIIMFYTMQGLKETEWTLTSDAKDFMQIALENIKRFFDDEDFILGDVIESDIQNISFDANTVFDALTTIAETFKCEWYLKGKKLNLVSKYEYGDPVILEREVAIADISRSNDNDKEYCTRLYAQGSTRNIPKNYRTSGKNETVDAIAQKRLRLPVSNGDYIDAIPNMAQNEILEKVVRFDDIYPKRIGTITELKSVDRTEDENNPFVVYFFKDSELEFKNEYILPGETLMISFQSGWLQGRDFELNYHADNNEFEIVNDTSNSDLTIPNEVLRPRIGDQYILYNFDISLISDQYIQVAEDELFEKAKEWLKAITEDNATYECPNVPGYCYQNGIDLDIGQRVQLISPVFMEGNKNSRIYGYTKSLFNKYICTYLVGDISKYSRLANIEKNIKGTKTLADIQYREVSKSVSALSYLRAAMENDTVIDKGIILTTLLRMGAKAGNEWKEHAGISGMYDKNDSIAFWAGGTFEDAVNNLASIILKMDGSGHLSKGNIAWNDKGDLGVKGRYESSNYNDDKVVIDSRTTEKGFKLITKEGFELGSIVFVYDEMPGEGLIKSGFLRFKTLSEDGKALGLSGLEPGRLAIYKYFDTDNNKNTPDIPVKIVELGAKDNEDTTEKTSYLQLKKLRDNGDTIGLLEFAPDRITIYNDIQEKMIELGIRDNEISYLQLQNLPTSKYGLKKGEIWRDGENLKIAI